MAAVLETPIFTITHYENLLDLESDGEDEPSERKITTWIKDGETYSASPHITLQKQLDPGIYQVHYSRDAGYFCSKLNYVSDQLFLFSDSITQSLLKEVNLFWSKKDLYKEYKLIHKRGILLEGFPGTGKTSIITQLSLEVIAQGGIVFVVKNFKNLDDYVGFLHSGFRKIQPDTPIITVLEGLDQYVEAAEEELLDFLDGKTNIDHHIIIATTNSTVNIPDTFFRPSRLDLRIEVPKASELTRKEYFEFKNVPEDVLYKLVKDSAGCSLADLKEIYICVFLLDYTIEDAIEKVKISKPRKNYLFSESKSTGMGL